MSQLSNAHGVVWAGEGRAEGWRYGQLIGTLPLPLTRADADLMLEMCLHRDPGDGTYAPGVTGTYFIYKDLMQAPLPPGLYENLVRDPSGTY